MPFERSPALIFVTSACVRDVDDRDRVGVLGGNVGAAAVGQEADAARALADRNRLDDFAARDVDDVDAVGFLGAHVEPSAVGTEDGVLGILALHRDALGDRQRRRIDDQHLVVLLDRRGEQAAVGRHVDAFRRVAELARAPAPTFAARSMTTRPLAVWSLRYRRLPSGATAMPRGLPPVVIVVRRRDRLRYRSPIRVAGAFVGHVGQRRRRSRSVRPRQAATECNGSETHCGFSDCVSRGPRTNRATGRRSMNLVC